MPSPRFTQFTDSWQSGRGAQVFQSCSLSKHVREDNMQFISSLRLPLFLGLIALLLVTGVVTTLAATVGEVHLGRAFLPAQSSEAPRAPGTMPKEAQPLPPSHPTEPTAPIKVVWSGQIAQIACSGGLLQLVRDGQGGTLSVHLTTMTRYTQSQSQASCSDLKVGGHVRIEVVQQSGQWIAIHVVQDDRTQPASSGDALNTGDAGSGDATSGSGM
jgi:hypothetical protein